MRIAASLIGCLLIADATSASAGEATAPAALLQPPMIDQAKLPSDGKAPRLHGETPRSDNLRGEPHPPRARICFNQTEARETITAHRLSDPLRALQQGREQGDALSARLCRWNGDEFVYEIHVLRRDGRVLRVYMNAQNGQAVPMPGGGDRDKDHR